MRTFLIFGGSGGIGRALVGRLLQNHPTARVVATGRSVERLQALQTQYPDATQQGRLHTHPMDASKSSDVDACLHMWADADHSLAGVAVCVGSIVLKPIHLTKDEDLADVIQQNILPAFYVTRASVKKFRQQNTASQLVGGSILLFSSSAARIGLANHEAIATAKAGVEGLMRSTATTYARDRIRVNALALGLVETPLSSKLLDNDTKRQASNERHPLGRIGDVTEVSSLASWLLSDDAGWITGQVFTADGGLSSCQTR